MSADRPRQLAKREALIEAAADVLRREGWAGCTARAISDASPLTKSALHYYFDDVDEIVELAFRRVMDEALSRVEAVAEAEADPNQALWCAARAFLELGGVGAGHPVTLWIDAYAATARSASFQREREELLDRGLGIFERIARRARWEDPARRVSVLYSALAGAVMRESVRPLDTDAFLDDLALALDLPAPRNA